MILNQPKNGISPHIGTDGNWYIGTTNTGILANGQSNVKITEVTLNAADWDTDTGSQTIQVIGVSANEAEQIVTLISSMESKTICNDSDIQCTGFATDSLTLTATTIPTEDIVIYVAIERAGDAHYEVYSTEETVVGRWIDGKPIYRRTFVTTSPNNAKIHITNTGDIETIIDMYGFWQNANENRYTIFPYVTSSGNGSYTSGGLENNNLFLWATGDGYINRPLVAHFEYTKTTDTATIEIPSATALAEAYEEGVQES